MDGRRFMIPLADFSRSMLVEMLRMSEEEFGLPTVGPITLPFDGSSMEFFTVKGNPFKERKEVHDFYEACWKEDSPTLVECDVEDLSYEVIEEILPCRVIGSNLGRGGKDVEEGEQIEEGEVQLISPIDDKGIDNEVDGKHEIMKLT
ncbi:hypothetical protein HPP92_012957 [Vanilla planifolia]|uniref:Uncharacterized protein n=1 Tax=Vanilla planifolia TaxID=51239 RepID=A0A835QS36_VANPL|nr:hypothetical protein HPP92_012957 [Vanilla planifolia]